MISTEKLIIHIENKYDDSETQMIGPFGKIEHHSKIVNLDKSWTTLAAV